MTEAMPFLQKTILLSYDPRPFAEVLLFIEHVNLFIVILILFFTLLVEHCTNLHRKTEQMDEAFCVVMIVQIASCKACK